MNFSATFKIAIWLLLFALPVQAVAATSMAHCVRMQRAAVLVTASVVAADAQSVDESAMPDCHGAGLKKADTADTADTGTENESKVSKADGKCSACAACCFAVAAVDANIAPAFLVGQQITQCVVAVGTITFLTAGLERPPKHLKT